MMEVLLEKRPDGIAVLTLNRPQALNAINQAMVGQLRSAIRDIEADENINIIIIAGSGDKSFCVGVDLKERATLSDEEADRFRHEELFPMYAELENRSKPAIAIVDGHCLAGGYEFVLSCDMVLATSRSTFGLPEVKWGLIPAAGGCRKLPKLIGAMRAKEMILTAATVDAAKAERLGMINRIVTGDELMDEAVILARKVLANVQIAVRGAKCCIDHAVDMEHSTDFDIEVAGECYASRQRKDGIASFVDKKGSK